MAEGGHPAIGKQLEDILIRDINEKEIHLFSLAGSGGLALGFMHGTWCAYCLQQLTHSNRYADSLLERSVTLVWVLEDPPSTIAAHLITAHPMPRFRALPESEPPILERLGLRDEVYASPTLIYVDPARTVRYVHAPGNPHSPHDIDTLLDIIDEIALSGGNHLSLSGE